MAVAAGQRTRAQVEAEILAEFRSRTPGSAQRHERASRVMPGGDTRTVAFHAPYPVYMDRGAGVELTDVDGGRYLDFLNNYTSLIHGHAHPGIVAAVKAQLPRGHRLRGRLRGPGRAGRDHHRAGGLGRSGPVLQLRHRGGR